MENTFKRTAKKESQGSHSEMAAGNFSTNNWRQHPFTFIILTTRQRCYSLNLISTSNCGNNVCGGFIHVSVFKKYISNLGGITHSFVCLFFTSVMAWDNPRSLNIRHIHTPIRCSRWGKVISSQPTTCWRRVCSATSLKRQLAWNWSSNKVLGGVDVTC